MYNFNEYTISIMQFMFFKLTFRCPATYVRSGVVHSITINVDHNKTRPLTTPWVHTVAYSWNWITYFVFFNYMKAHKIFKLFEYYFVWIILPTIVNNYDNDIKMTKYGFGGLTRILIILLLLNWLKFARNVPVMVQIDTVLKNCC